MHHRSGKLRCAAGAGQVDHLCDHDRVLCAAVLRLAQALPDRRTEERDRRCVRPVRCARCAVHDAAEPVAHQPHPAGMGHPAQCALCPAGSADHRAVLPQRQAEQRQGFPLDVADHRAELRLLYPRCSVGRREPHDRYADDPQDLRLRLDRAHRLQRHEDRDRQAELTFFPCCLTENPPTDSDALLCRRAFYIV